VDGSFDLVGCALRELSEELAVEGSDLEEPLRPALVSTGERGFIGVLFTPRLTVPESAVRSRWRAAQGSALDDSRNEFNSLVTVERRAADVAAYLASEARPLADYIAPLLTAMTTGSD
jgi:hypothetical protein